MDNSIIKSSGSFSIHINGDSSVDAIALSQIISDMATLTREAAIAEESTADCKVSVTAFKNGSFQIDFTAVAGAAATLLTQAATIANIASNAITTVKGYFEVKKVLNGSMPKEVKELSGNKILVTAEDGGTVLVNKGCEAVYINCNVDNRVQNITNCINQLENANGFSFDTDEGSSNYDKNDIDRISKPLPFIEESLYKISKVKTDLLIKKPDLLGHSTWSFRWNDKNIDAKIQDDDFLEYIHSGNYSIHGGSFITAEMEIIVRLNEDGTLDERSVNYVIKKVYGGIQDFAASMQSMI